MEVIVLNNSERLETLRFGITVDEARKQLGIGRNLMLKLVTVPGFPAIRFKRKIIINGNKLQEWFDKNYGQYGKYKY
jgi:hypothetical protein